MAEIIPTELIEHILSYAVHVDTQTCLSICLTNKMGQKVATPALYRVVGSFARPGEDPPHISSASRRFKALALLCRTLLENRALAAHVLEFRQYCDMLIRERIEAPPFLDTRLVQKLLDEEFQFHPRARQTLEMLEDGILMRDLEDFVPEIAGENHRPKFGVDIYSSDDYGNAVYVCVAVVVLACTRLRCIEVQGDPDVFGSLELFSRIRQQTSAGTPVDFEPYIKSVDELVVTNFGQHDYMLDYITLWALLPGLKKLTIKQMEDTRGASGPYADQLLDIEELTFDACLTTPDTIANIVTECPRLKTLDISAVEWYRYLDCSLLGATLVQCTPLLERLRIEWPPSPKRRERHHGIVRSLGSLRDLEHLHTVCISNPILFGWSEDGVEFLTLDEVLPHSVKHLDIIIDSDEFSPVDRSILTMPGVERLERLAIFNQDKTKSLSRATEHNQRKRKNISIDLTSQPEARHQRLE